MLSVMIKWNKSCQKLNVILSLLIAFSLICSVGAACLRPQFVFASTFAGTLAGYILTLFASFNTAITNTQVVTAINQTFGNVALEASMDAQMIDNGIAQIAASTGFDMSTIFATTAAEAEQVMEAAGITGTVATAMTAGQNLAFGGEACFSSATHAVLPVVGGVVLPLAGAVAAGIATGVLINHIRERVVNFIQAGKPITASEKEMQNAADLAAYPLLHPTNQYSFIGIGYGSIACAYPRNSNGTHLVIKTFDNPSKVGLLNDNFTFYTWGSLGANGITHTAEYPVSSLPVFDTYDECVDYLSGFDKPINNTNVSPDLIGSFGNQRGEYDSTDGEYKTPGIRPAYDYGTNVVSYIPPSDYEDFVNDANQNTDIGDTEQDPQGDLFDGFINPYIAPVEDPSIPENPDQPENPDNPVQKPTVPYPDPEEYPDAIPEVNPVPDTDIAPTAIPYPELPDPTQQDITDTNDKITPFDLKNKFPFCLPFDIHKALSKLKGAREAPYFVWQIPFGDAGEQTVTVDLRAWDEVASILRLLELLLFIVGLAVATRNLIGGT